MGQTTALDDGTAAAPWGFVLVLGDRDADDKNKKPAHYGNTPRPAASTPKKLIETLHAHLETAGFRMGFTKRNEFSRRTEWAVREFQAYAKQDWIAKETGTSTEKPRYVDRLSREKNPTDGEFRYKGEINGVVDEDLFKLIKHWADNKRRCPVVMEAWDYKPKPKPKLARQNVWTHHEWAYEKGYRVFAQDLLREKEIDAQASDERHSDFGKGLYVAFKTAYGACEGPKSEVHHKKWTFAWTGKSELLPDAFPGLGRTETNGLFRAIRAVADVEVAGFPEQINAYDKAFLSVGTYHWTIANAKYRSAAKCTLKTTALGGEFNGVLAYLRATDPEEYAKWFGNWGIDAQPGWREYPGHGIEKGLWNSSLRIFEGQLKRRKFDKRSKTIVSVSLDETADADHLRIWHSVYRFSMATRMSAALREAMAKFAMMRVRDIVSAPLPSAGPWGPTALQVGDLYNSERSVALLLRWHTNLPGRVIVGGRAASDTFKAAYAAAKVFSGTQRPTEPALSLGLLKAITGKTPDGHARLNRGIWDSMREVFAWPQWAGSARQKRYSLQVERGEATELITVEKSQADDIVEELPRQFKVVTVKGKKIAIPVVDILPLPDLLKKKLVPPEFPVPKPGDYWFAVRANTTDPQWVVVGKAGTETKWFNLRMERKGKQRQFLAYHPDAASTLSLAPGSFQADWSTLPAEPYPSASNGYGGYIFRNGDWEGTGVKRRKQEARFVLDEDLRAKLPTSGASAPAPEIRAAFETAGFPLSPSGAMVTVQTPASHWVLKDQPGFPDFDLILEAGDSGPGPLSVSERLYFRYQGALVSERSHLPTPSDPDNGYIRLLQEHLIQTGFLAAGLAIGIFGPKSTAAVKKFQELARHGFAADRDPTRSDSDPYAVRFRHVPISPELLQHGAADGRPDAETRYLLEQWIDISRQWRNPLLIFAVLDDGSTPSVFEDLAQPEDCPLPGTTVMVRDLSGCFLDPMPAAIELGRVPDEPDPEPENLGIEIPSDCALDDGPASVCLRNAFALGGITLSDRAEVKNLTPSQRWLVRDPGETETDEGETEEPEKRYWVSRITPLTAGSTPYEVLRYAIPEVVSINRLEPDVDPRREGERGATAEVTPENLLDPDSDEGTDPAHLDTILTLRALLETLGAGVLDAVRLAPGRVLQWAGLDLVSPGMDEDDEDPPGTLGPLLAQMREYSPRDYLDLVEELGLELPDPWREDDGSPTGAPLFDTATRTYRARLRPLSPPPEPDPDADAEVEDQERALRASTEPDTASVAEPNDAAPAAVATDAGDERFPIDSLRTWTWMHRFKMAARMRPSVRRSIYDFYRIRLRELMDTPWRADRSGPRLGQVFASRRSAAVLALWHQLQPEEVVADGQASARLQGVLTAAGLDPDDHAAWDATEERQLLLGLLESVPDGLEPKTRELLTWPAWDPNQVSEQRRGFPAELLTLAEVPDSDGSLAMALQTAADGPSPTAIPDALRSALLDDADWPLPLGEAFTLETITFGAHWMLRDFGGSEALSLRLRKHGGSLQVYGGPSPRRYRETGWLNRDGLSPAPEPPFTTPIYVVPIGDIADAGGDNANRLRAGLVYLDDEGKHRLVALSLSRSGDPQRGIEVPVADGATATAPVFGALDDASPDRSQMVRRTSGSSLPIPLRRALSAPAGRYELPLELDAWLPSGTALTSGARLVLDDLALVDGSGDLKGKVRLETDTTGDLLRRPLALTCLCDGDADTDPNALRAFDWQDGAARFRNASIGPPSRVLPIDGLPGNLAADLLVSAEGASWKPAIDSGEDPPRVPLSAGAITLLLGGGFDLELASSEGLRLASRTGTDFLPTLRLTPFTTSPNWGDAVVDQPWARSGADNSSFAELLSIPSEAVTSASLIAWRDRIPKLDPVLFSALEPAEINPGLRLSTMVGSWPGETKAGTTKLAASKHAPHMALDEAAGQWHLGVPVKMLLSGAKDSLALDGRFVFSVDADEAEPAGAIPFTTSALALEPRIELSVGETRVLRPGGNSIALEIPAGTGFTLDTDPVAPRLRVDEARTLERTSRRILLRCPGEAPGGDPARNRFTFELSQLEIGPDGLDLLGSVRNESVCFSGPVAAVGAGCVPLFREDLQMHPARPSQSTEPVSGQIASRQSRLTFGHVATSTRLRFFDDAPLTFEFLFAQGPGADLRVQGSARITRSQRFPVARLWTTFELHALEASLAYSRDGSSDRWAVDGNASGGLLFAPPQGQSASSVGPAEALFGGLRMGFEELNPFQLATKGLSLSPVTPLAFSFAGLLDLRVRGLSIALDPLSTSLDGDIAIRNLGPFSGSAGFDKLLIEAGSPPQVGIGKLDIELGLEQVFELAASIEQEAGPNAFGYAGRVKLATELLDLDGHLKWGRVRALQERAFAEEARIYAEQPVSYPLVAGFFLRSLALGLGINTRLRGLGDLKPGEKPVDRLVRLVKDPSGLPMPNNPDNWQTQPPKRASQRDVLLVGKGDITFGNASEDTEHVVAGNMLASADRDKLVIGANVWAFASPKQIASREFRDRPLARAGLEISRKHESLSFVGTTVKDAKFGDSAPEPLPTMLKGVEAGVVIEADRNGVQLSAGWPYDLKLPYNKPPFQGSLTGGVRFGAYKGAIAFGVNQKVDIRMNLDDRVGWDTKYGALAVKLEVSGTALAAIEIAGGLKPDFSPLLAGGMAVQGTLGISANGHGRLGPKWSPLKLDIQGSASVGIKADLAFALNSSGFGLSGSVEGAIGVRGRTLTGDFSFRLNADRIDTTKQELRSLLPELPKLSDLTSAARIAQGPDAARCADDERLALGTTNRRRWQYDIQRRELSPGGPWEVRVLLFPAPEWSYPRLADGDQRRGRFAFPLAGSWDEFDGHFKGFLGSEPRPREMQLDEQTWAVWDENLDQVVFTVADLEAAPGQFDADADAVPHERRDYRFRDVLGSLERQDRALAPEQRIERQDPRRYSRRPGDTTDDSSQLVPEGYLASPVLKADTAYDRALAEACRPRPREDRLRSDDDLLVGFDSNGLFAGLVALQKDTAVQAGIPAPGYRLAPHCNCVLAFEFDDESKASEDPMARFFKLDEDGLLLAGEPAVVEAADIGTDKEFHLEAWASGADETSIALAWDFGFEGQPDGLAALRYLDEMRVSRVDPTDPSRSRRVATMLPCHILGPKVAGAPREYVRPPHDCIDSDLTELVHDEQPWYRIEAMGRDGRPLASTLFPVQWRPVKPLAPPTRAVAHQLLIRNAEHRERIDAGEIRLYVTIAEDDSPFQPEDLVLRYREVTATSGSYGSTTEPTAPIVWESGLPSAYQVLAPEGNVRFGLSEDRQGLSYERTEPLPLTSTPVWTPITLVPDDATDEQLLTGAGQRAYLARISECDLWKAVGALEPETGIALYVGRERMLDGGPLMRSLFRRCTQYYRAEPGAVSEPPDLLPESELIRASHLRAFEPVPARVHDRGSIEWLNPTRFERPVVTYPSEQLEGSQRDTATVQLSWHHEQAGSGEPVVGYRLYRGDALDTGEQQPGLIRMEPLQTIRVVRDQIHRASPERVFPEQRPQSASEPRRASTDWVLGNKRVVIWDSDPDEPLPPADDGMRAPLQYLPAADDGTRTPLQEEARHVPNGPVWLFRPLVVALEAIEQALSGVLDMTVSADLLLEHPLVDRGPLVIRAIDELAKLLAPPFDAPESARQQDPFGWRTLEALGLSLTCRFRNKDGNAIPPERILAAPVLGKVKAVLDGTNCPVSILFHRPDEASYLYGIRLVLAEPEGWQLWPDGAPKPNEFYFSESLGALLRGRDGTQAHPPAYEPREDDKDAIETWFEGLRERALEAYPEDDVPAGTGFEWLRSPGGTTTDAPAVALLPVKPGSRLAWSYPMSDRWAHREHLALRVERRFDRVRRELSAIEAAASPLADSGGEPDALGVAFEDTLRVPVSRCESIEKPSLIALPVPGGIQAIVFKHPADLAAQARADIAARGEFSGTTRALFRRLPNQVRTRIEQIVTGWDKDKVDWSAYERWLQDDSSGRGEAIEPAASDRVGPWLVRPLDGERDQIDMASLSEVPGGDAGLPFADRLVVPYLPGYYYEYQFGAYVRAGRVTSSLNLSDPVQPLFQSHLGKTDEERALIQSPWTYPAVSAKYHRDSGQRRLQITVRLVAPRLHLPACFGRLWIDADRDIPVGDDREIKLGSLPDLDLGYLVALRTFPGPNTTPEPEEISRQLMLCEIEPPVASATDSDRTDYRVRSFLPQLVPRGTPDEDGPTPLVVATRGADGSLILKLEFELSSPSPLDNVLEALEAASLAPLDLDLDLGPIVNLAAIRHGLVSALVSRH